LITYLLGSSPGSIKMKKGSLACLKISPPSKQGQLKFLIPPLL